MPCGITGLGVTSLAAEGIDASMREVVDLVASRASEVWAPHGRVDRADVAFRTAPGDMAQFTLQAHAAAMPVDGAAAPGGSNGGGAPVGGAAAPGGSNGGGAPVGGAAAPGGSNGGGAPVGGGDGTSPRLLGRMAQARLQGGDETDSVPYRSRKPEWMRVPLNTGPTFREIRSTLRDLDLVTVCEGGRLPQHLGVLERRHGHLHDPGGALHPGLRILPGRHPPARTG